MKVRVKFSKEGSMKFIGHLDIMRYFQKAVRRAGLQASYSGGYSPHMIMSFASPLGVGITSTGEYFDLELDENLSSAEMTKRLNEVMAEGMSIQSVRQVEEGKAGKAMSLVSAADYRLTFKEGKEPKDWKKQLESFCAQPEIRIWKKTKTSEAEVDIRPYLYEVRAEEQGIFMCLSAGSVQNTKPELVMEAFAAFMGVSIERNSFCIHRLDLYADVGTPEEPKRIPLEALGEEIE